MQRETHLEIDSKRLSHNLNVFRSKIRPETKILANLKGNAYGLGADVIGKFLEKKGVDYFSVAYINEGVTLRSKGIQANLLVFNPSIDYFEDLVQYRLEPEISSLHYLKNLLAFLRKNRIKNFPVHIKLDTGMHRAGIEEDELNKLIEWIHSSEEIRIKSVFSHLAAAEDPEKDAFTQRQFDLFDTLTSILKNKIPHPFFRHILNTAGVFRFPGRQYEMIRPGLGIFGFNLVQKSRDELLPVAQLKTKINQIKHLKKGESAGYNNRFIASADHTKIALLPIGYADGIDRRLGNGKWKVKINNREAPVAGTISMDTMSVDVSQIDCKPGDEVLVFDNENDVYTLSGTLQTIPYEITTRLSLRVERRIK